MWRNSLLAQLVGDVGCGALGLLPDADARPQGSTRSGSANPGLYYAALSGLVCGDASWRKREASWQKNAEFPVLWNQRKAALIKCHSCLASFPAPMPPRGLNNGCCRETASLNKTDAGKGLYGICRVIDALRSPSPDPKRSPNSTRCSPNPSILR